MFHDDVYFKSGTQRTLSYAPPIWRPRKRESRGGLGLRARNESLLEGHYMTVIVSGSWHEPSILLNPTQPGQAATTNFILQGCKKTKEFPQICISHWGLQNHVCPHVASIAYCFVIAIFTPSLLYCGLSTFSSLICVLDNPMCDTFYMNTNDFYIF